MSILTNTHSFRRYFINGDLPKDFPKNSEPDIERYSFRELRSDSPEDMSVGWVSIDNPFLNPIQDYSYNRYTYIAMTMRIDKKIIPPKTLKSYILKEETMYMEEKGTDRLSKREKSNIKDVVLSKLFKQVLPKISTYDFLWNLQESRVYFFSASVKVNSMFVELFENTFHLSLMKMAPFNIALHNGITEDMLLGIKKSNIFD